MADTLSNMVPLGTIATPFNLMNPKTGKRESLDKLRGQKGTLIVFMCNHCPFVKHVIDKLVELYEDYRTKGIEFIGINSNDIEKYPHDSPENMVKFAEERNISFSYLFDETQEIARAYDAACTPDFYLYDHRLRLIYRGQMDSSRPRTDVEVTGEDLVVAFENLLAGEPQEDEQIPSIGCNIKYRV